MHIKSIKSIKSIKKRLLLTYFTHLKDIKSTKCNKFCRCFQQEKISFIQLFYAPKKAEKTTFSYKNHKTTCFVTLLSGDKKISSLFI